MNNDLKTKEDIDLFLMNLQRRLYSAVKDDLPIKINSAVGSVKQNPAGRLYESFRAHPTKFTVCIEVNGGGNKLTNGESA